MRNGRSDFAEHIFSVERNTFHSDFKLQGSAGAEHPTHLPIGCIEPLQASIRAGAVRAFAATQIRQATAGEASWCPPGARWSWTWWIAVVI